MSRHDDCPFKFTRQRKPIVFYGPEGLIRNYKQVDALCYDVFKKLMKNEDLITN
jgi:hypothetical protein